MDIEQKLRQIARLKAGQATAGVDASAPLARGLNLVLETEGARYVRYR